MADNSPLLSDALSGLILSDREGKMRIGLPRVRAFGVANLAEVVDHRIVAIFDSISHHVSFTNGGELYYVFNGRNELVEMTITSLSFKLTPDGNCLFGTL